MRVERALVTVLGLTLAVSLSFSAFAQLRTDVSGSAELRLGLDASGTFHAAGAHFDLTVEGEVGSEYFPSASFRVQAKAEADAATGHTTLVLGDAWARLYLDDGTIEATLGNQTVFWGSTDGVNPVDRLNPRDRTVPIDSEKLPVPMLHLRAYLASDTSLEAALLPAFVPSVPPGEAWRTAPTLAPPPGVTVTEVLPLRDERPEATLENVQLATRVQWRPAGFDLAASYLYLFRDVPTRSAEVVPTGAPSEVALQPVARYGRLHVIGVDGSVALGDVVLRGEAAYGLTADPGGTDPTVGNPSFQVVVGAEIPVPDGPRLVAQAILDGETRDASPTGEAGGIELGLRTMLIAAYAVDTRTDLKAVWVHDFGGSGMLRPALSYTFADGVTGTLAGFVAYGPAGTRFGDWRERSGATASLRVDF